MSSTTILGGKWEVKGNGCGGWSWVRQSSLSSASKISVWLFWAHSKALSHPTWSPEDSLVFSACLQLYRLIIPASLPAVQWVCSVPPPSPPLTKPPIRKHPWWAHCCRRKARARSVNIDTKMSISHSLRMNAFLLYWNCGNKWKCQSFCLGGLSYIHKKYFPFIFIWTIYLHLGPYSRYVLKCFCLVHQLQLCLGLFGSDFSAVWFPHYTLCVHNLLTLLWVWEMCQAYLYFQIN